MPLVGKEFQIYGALIYWEIDILTQTLPIKNYSLGSYHHPPGRGKLMIPPRQRSLKNLVQKNLPSRKGEGGNYVSPADLPNMYQTFQKPLL